MAGRRTWKAETSSGGHWQMVEGMAGARLSANEHVAGLASSGSRNSWLAGGPYSGDWQGIDFILGLSVQPLEHQFEVLRGDCEDGLGYGRKLFMQNTL